VVLRSYDTHLRPTSRSPDVYLSAKVKKTYGEDLQEEPPMQRDLQTLGRPLLFLAKKTASSNVRNFGDVSDIQQVSAKQQDWLWDNNGKLQLIETAFQKSGSQNAHEAQKPGDFIPIINHLLHLHEQDFVHGDIRAFNMVFNGNDGKLIDFDLSGKVGTSKYPPCYKNTLPDAIRCGQVLSLIEKHHDWYALGKVIFSFHGFQAPDNLGQQDKILLTYEKSNISESFNKLISEKELFENDMRILVGKLKNLLNLLDSKRFICMASDTLYLYYYVNNMQGDGPATGSPNIVKN
jgi:serine/threonine protein kinase